MIDSLRRVLQYAIEFLEIVPGTAEIDPDIVNIDDLIAAYDALAPKPDAWPNGAKWYTIDADGVCCWHEVEPTLYTWAWESTGMGWAGVVVIPLGLDWRLLKWQRPEVTP